MVPEKAGQMGDFSKERGKKEKTRDCIDSLFTHVNHDLLICKLFYFFFFAAFGSLLPLLAVYFKQLGMSPMQSGVLMGFRPFVEFCSAPLWGNLADKYRKGKQVLLFALFCWVAFTLALAFIQPPAHSCIAYNSTRPILEEPLERNRRATITDFLHDRDYTHIERPVVLYHEWTDKHLKLRKRSLGEGPVNLNQAPEDIDDVGKSPQDVGPDLVSPRFSSIVYKDEDVQEVFLLLLLLVVVGEFFSAPAITLADSATLASLGDDVENYGRQRMFGSLGWGMAMFFVGIALDHSTTFPDHPCNTQEKGEKNYIICFAVFSVLMSCAFICATQFRFVYGAYTDEPIALHKLPGKVKKKAKNFIDGTQKIRHKHLVEEEDDDVFPEGKDGGYTQTDEYGNAIQRSNSRENQQYDQNGKPLEIKVEANQDMVADAVKSQDSKEIYSTPKWITVFRLLGNLKYGSFLFLSWFMGFGIGLIFTFLFWHLQDLGGSPTLFGMASVINHISEIFAYFFSSRIISQIGHVKVLYVGLIGNVARFLYISWLRSPWWVLPFEFVQGITHALVWAACCSYITQATPSNLRSSAQGILQGLHHGLGRGCGAVFGGIMVHFLGSAWTFRIYGFACIAIFIFFVGVNYFTKDQLPPPEKIFQKDEDEPKEYLEETSVLAPCGVPMNPMSRNLSSSKLQDMDENHGNSYGAVNSTNGYLDPRKTSNYGYDQDSRGYQSYTDPSYNQGGIVMGAPPPVHTDVHMQQPEQRQTETQYQYSDDW